ncbi:MAG: hypothetical protein AMJ75_02325, partial [Phycisphaerae bacterium SM1_79]
CGNADPLAFAHKLDWGREPQHDADQWKRDIDTLASQKNVICKISGIIARVPKGKASAGAPLHVWTNLLREIVRKRSSDERRRLFWSNAHRFYGLS